MAGLTTASLVALDEPELAEWSAQHVPQQSRRATQWLGMDPQQCTTLNAVGLVSTSLLSIMSLVFLNTTQPFILDMLGVNQHSAGSITGTLLLVDESVALCGYLVAGLVVDKFGVRWVAVTGHCIVAIALGLYVTVHNVFPALLLARVVFACGASALVIVLSAALSTMTALPTPPPPSTADHEPTETQPLLASDADRNQPRPEHAARFAGLLGMSAGLGALLAVSVFLPLPTRLADWFPAATPSASLHRGLRWTFFVVAAIAVVEAVFLAFALKTRSSSALTPSDEKVSARTAVIRAVKELPLGFQLAAKNGSVVLSYVSSFASRSSATIITAFIPLLINHYFVTHSLCHDQDHDDNHDPTSLIASTSSPGDITCRAAFIYSSILTGTIQLISLLACPIIGYLSSRSARSQPLVLLCTSALGTASFLALAVLRDPRARVVWFCAVGIGLAQAGGIVLSLAVLAKARGELVVVGDGGGGDGPKREVGGALSAVYSFSGGIGILLVGQLGGSLFDRWTGAPFMLIALVDAVVVVCAAIVWASQKRRRS